MTTEHIVRNGSNICVVSASEIIIHSPEEAFDIMINCAYQGADSIILYEQNISPDFFDLKTRMAGEILQKFSTYRVRLAIVGEFSKYNSKSLNDFIYESNKGRLVNFVSDTEAALSVLSGT